MRRVTPKRQQFLERSAARMRECPTPIERTVWNRLKNRQFLGLWFTNQEVVGRYILDFYCAEKRLAVEVDGGDHLHRKRQYGDMRRDFELEQSGVRVIRIHSHAVKNDLEFQLERIALAAGAAEKKQFSTDSTGNTEKKEEPRPVKKLNGCSSCHGTGWILSEEKPRLCLFHDARKR